MTTATKLPKPSRAEIEQARRKRFRRTRSTPAQQKLMKAGDPMEKARQENRGRIVLHCHHRCFTCSKFVGNDGGCSGVRQSDPNNTPICQIDLATGRMRAPMAMTAAGGLRLASGQDKHWRTATLGESGRAVVIAPRETADVK